jgi:hypothetical protein
MPGEGLPSFFLAKAESGSLIVAGHPAFAVSHFVTKQRD